MNIQENGIEIERQFLPRSTIQDIVDEVSNSGADIPKHGIRNAEKKFQTIAELVHSNLLRDKAREILGTEPDLVRALFFDKTPDKNWLVTWHQDKTIAVNRRKEISNWGPWSLKDNVHHVQPDISVLNRMVTFRLHLDDADEQNGCLKAILNSHEKGVIQHAEIHRIIEHEQPYICTVKAGDAVIMRPHILHASSKSTSPFHRRVVHMEFSDYNLPAGLMWA